LLPLLSFFKAETVAEHPLREFSIPFVGLKNGVHHFRFDVKDEFFAAFEGTLIDRGDVQVDLAFDKKDSFFLLNFMISGKVNLPCNRCNEMLDFPVDADYSVVVKFDEHREDEQDDSNADVIYINRGDTHLDVSQLVYEFITLSIPEGRVICENSLNRKECNPKAIEILEVLKVKDEEPKADPRWEGLQKIKLNNNAESKTKTFKDPTRQKKNSR
jgi:uncharacterized protein